LVSLGKSYSLYGIGHLPHRFDLDCLSRKRVVALGPEERCIWNKNYAKNFRGVEQATSLFAGKGQAVTEAKELNSWSVFLQ
jgi:hypothetical protein